MQKISFLEMHLEQVAGMLNCLMGTIMKYYVDLPSDIGTVSLHFPKTPKSHLGKEIMDNSIVALSRLYLEYLQKLIKKAKERFES